MLLLRKKPEPQPASEAAEARTSEVPPEPTPQTDVDEAPSILHAIALPEKVPAAKTTAANIPNQPERHLHIAKGISFRGEIAGCDRLVIDGAVEGEIKVCRYIAVSKGGSFKGIAGTDQADIAGSCAGSLTVEKKLFIARTAHVFGSVHYGRLSIEEGCELDADLRQLKRQGEGQASAEETGSDQAPSKEDATPYPAAEDPVTDAEVKGDAVERLDVDSLFAAAVAARDLSRFDEAESLFKQVAAKSPDHAAALANLGGLARRRGDRVEALAHAEVAADPDPQNVGGRCKAAAMLHEAGRTDEAEAIYKSVLEADPKHVGALSGLGRLAHQRGDRAGALAYFEAALKADSRDTAVRCDLARIMREVFRFGEAEAMYKSVLEIDKEHVDALTGLGHIARQRGELDAAIAYFEAASKGASINPELRCELAATLREASRFDEAERVLRAVVETHPQHVAALTGLGHLARQRADRSATLRWFEAAVAAEPADISIRVEFARALRQHGEFARARQVIEKVLNDEPRAARA